MLAVAGRVVTVDRGQSLVEVKFIEVRMHFATKPFAKSLRRFVTLLMHLLLAKRAMLVKEPPKEIHQHELALLVQLGNGAHDCVIDSASQATHFSLVTTISRARGMPI
jgi:hypothetical protein